MFAILEPNTNAQRMSLLSHLLPFTVVHLCTELLHISVQVLIGSPCTITLPLLPLFFRGLLLDDISQLVSVLAVRRVQGTRPDYLANRAD